MYRYTQYSFTYSTKDGKLLRRDEKDNGKGLFPFLKLFHKLPSWLGLKKYEVERKDKWVE